LKADVPFEYRIRPAGIFDVEGPDAESFLQGQLTQDVHALPPGEARPAAGLNPKGKLLYLARAVGTGGGIRLLVPAASRERVFQHLSKYSVFQKVTLTDRSAEFARMGVYGSAPLPAPEPSGSMSIAGEGEFTSEILLPLHALEAFEGALESAGARRIGDEQAEVRRVEAGRPRFGQEAEEGSFLDELSMEEAISRTKGCYVGQEIVARIRTYGRVNRRLVGFRFPDGPIPAGERLKGIEEVEAGKTEQGRVTSSVRSSRVGAIGLGFAFREVATGQRLVWVTDPRRGAVVCPPRFS
jgi:folate-binding protein YgfZ